MEAPETNAQLGEELEGRLQGHVRNFHRIGRVVVVANNGAAAKLVRSEVLEGMPVADRETQMFGHRLAKYNLVRIIMPECKRILRVGPLIFYLFYSGKVLCHFCCSFPIARTKLHEILFTHSIADSKHFPIFYTLHCTLKRVFHSAR